MSANEAMTRGLRVGSYRQHAHRAYSGDDDDQGDRIKDKDRKKFAFSLHLGSTTDIIRFKADPEKYQPRSICRKKLHDNVSFTCSAGLKIAGSKSNCGRTGQQLRLGLNQNITSI